MGCRTNISIDTGGRGDFTLEVLEIWNRFLWASVYASASGICIFQNVIRASIGTECMVFSSEYNLRILRSRLRVAGKGGAGGLKSEGLSG